MKKVFVTGSAGLVGSRFLELQKENFNITAREIDKLDITNKSAVEKYFSKNKFDAIINFAAFTDVSAAEMQREDKKGACWQVNAGGVGNLLDALDPVKTQFIQISTDMVFPGNTDDPGPYSEGHKPETKSSKLTWYGFTKAEAERIVKERFGDRATIVRLIYPVRSRFDEKLDYLRKPLKLFDEGKLYPLFNDQQISITFIDEACLVIEKLIKQKIHGIFHASCPDTTSPYEIISYLIRKVRGVKSAVEVTSLDEFLKTVGNKSRYPKYGGLSVKATEKVLGIRFGPWREIIDKLILQGL